MFIAHEKYAHTHPMEVSKNKSILLTNTRPLTSREKAFWARCGYVGHHQALLSVQFLPVNQLDVDPQAIVLTSANGALALEHSDWDRSIPVYDSGQIELQNHGNPLSFRNVFVREIPRG